MTALTTLGSLATMLAVAYLAIGVLDEISRQYHPGETDGPIAHGALFNLGYWVALSGILLAAVEVYDLLPAALKAVVTVGTVVTAAYRGYEAYRAAQ